MCPAGSRFGVLAPAACSVQGRQEGPAEGSLRRSSTLLCKVGGDKTEGQQLFKNVFRMSESESTSETHKIGHVDSVRSVLT